MWVSLRSKVIFSLLLIALTRQSPCLGQKDLYIFRNIKTSAGLASDVVTSILQDDRGFMWLATGNGLQKYDGNSFITYHHDPYDSLSIPTDNVGSLMQDRKKDLWIFTAFLGFDVFSPVAGKNTGGPDLVSPSFRDLNRSIIGCLDARGNPWLISLGTLEKYDEEHHRLVSYDDLLPKDKPIGTPKSVLCDPRTGNLWLISYSYGLCMLDPVKKIICHQWNNPDNLPIFHLVRDPGTFYLDRESNLWVSSYSGELYKYNLITRQARQYFPGKTITIDCIMQDRTGTIWMGARSDGLAKYDPRTDSFSLISRDPQMPGGLDYDRVINCVYEDREGNIWIGSDKGISIFNPYRQQFRSVNLGVTKNEVVNTTAVLNFVQTKTNDIWLATYGQGIQVFDEHLEYKTSFTYKGTHGHVGEPGERVWSFLTQPDGNILIGSQHGWIAVYDQKTGSFINSQPPRAGKAYDL